MWTVGAIQKSCGCAGVEVEKDLVGPNQTLTGTVTLAVPSDDGAFRKTAMIDVGGGCKVSLEISGTSVAPFSVARREVVFRPGESEVIVDVRTSGGCSVSVLECSDWCSANIEQEAKSGRELLRVSRHLDVSAPTALGKVILESNSGFRRTLPIRIEQKPDLVVRPSLVYFGEVAVGETAVSNVTLSGMTNEKLEVDFETPNQLAEMSFQPVRNADGEFVIRSTMIGVQPGFVMSRLRVSSGDRSVQIPVVARVR